MYSVTDCSQKLIIWPFNTFVIGRRKPSSVHLELATAHAVTGVQGEVGSPALRFFIRHLQTNALLVAGKQFDPKPEQAKWLHSSLCAYCSLCPLCYGYCSNFGLAWVRIDRPRISSDFSRGGQASGQLSRYLCFVYSIQQFLALTTGACVLLCVTLTGGQSAFVLPSTWCYYRFSYKYGKQNSRFS